MKERQPKGTKGQNECIMIVLKNNGIRKFFTFLGIVGPPFNFIKDFIKTRINQNKSWEAVFQKLME